MDKNFTFAFLRHGAYQQKPNVPSAFQPYPLTKEGVTQSNQAADLLQRYSKELHKPISETLYSSNLLRAWQTAKTLQTQLPGNQSVFHSVELNERSMGAVANLTVDEINQILQDDPRFEAPAIAWKSNSHYRLPFDGCESLLDAGQRVADFIYTKASQNRHQLTVFVGHGASFRHAAYHMGILEFNDIAKLSMHYAEPIVFEWQSDTQTFNRLFGDWKYRDLTDAHTEQLID